MDTPRRRRSPRSANGLARAPLAQLVVLINAAALGYRLTEGWDWGDCYWQVAITLTTVGYGDQLVATGGGRWVTVLLLLGGLVVVQQTLQWLLTLEETGYFQRRRRRRRLRELSRMRHHVIVCGYGRIGREIAQQLSREDIPMLVLETDPDQVEAARERNIEVQLADATLDETLEEAGIHHCRALVAALPSNAANLYVVLSARGLSPHCRLIARADSSEAERKLRQAGADAVVSPYIAGGRIMAATALRPLALNFMDLLAGSDCEIDEFQLSNQPGRLRELEGRSLAELALGRRSGATVLAIVTPRNDAWNPYGSSRSELQANPGGHVQLHGGQRLVVMGSSQQLQEFARLLGPALESAESVQP